MWRALFLLLLVSMAASAAPTCEIGGAEALAKVKGVAVKDLPGLDGTTKLQVRYRDGVVDDITIATSSGNRELDDIFRACVDRGKAETGANFSTTVNYPWKNVLAPPLGSAFLPRPKGHPHICLSDYPAAAVEEHREGIVALTFEVTPAGTVEALTVASSSGSLDLDLASIRCAAKWLYQWDTEAGPENVPWHVEVSWMMGSNRLNFPSPSPLKQISSCVKAYADAPQRAAAVAEGVSVVRYTLKDGVVTAASVVHRSGDSVLDGYAVACVKGWSFRPHYDSGLPATGDHSAIVDWKQKFAP